MTGVVAGIAIAACITGAVAFGVKSWGDSLERERLALYASAPYSVGQIVRSKVGGFRGVVSAISCGNVCTYRVRFPVASMQEQWVSAYEIEPSK